MGKSRRILLPNYPHHLLRASSGREAFHSAADFRYASAELRALSLTYDLEVHAYCILPDRIQLLATPRSAPELISTFMKSFSARIALRNRKLYRSASPWSPRFTASPVEPGHWALACMACIECLPVSCGLVRTPGHYRFSSFRLRSREADQSWINDLAEYQRLGDTPAARLQSYKLYLRSGVDEREVKTVNDALLRNGLTGSSRFVEEVCKNYGITVVSRGPGRPKKNAP